MRRILAYTVGTVLVLTAYYGVERENIVPFVPPVPVADADNVELNGYAWSDTIGWISLNCETGGPTGNDICATSNYAVTITSNDQGNPMPVSGYGWSEHIGWIKFGTSSGCPWEANPGECDTVISSTTLSGFARACAVFASGCSGALRGSGELGGWDGWIALSKPFNAPAPAYGVSVGNGIMSGYAWGSDVVGWVDMGGVTFNAPCAGSIGYSCSADLTARLETNQWCQIATTTCALGNLCDVGTNLCTPQAVSGSFIADSERVRTNASTTLRWNMTNVGTCTVTSNPSVLTFSFTSTTPWTATSTGPIANMTTYTLTCNDTNEANPSQIGQVTVGVLPFIEQF